MRLSKLLRTLATWLESGDLVPLLVGVSAVHYAWVLAGHDIWPVAVAIGILVDLGHYRLIRHAVKYSGSRWQAITIRWAFAALMSVIALAYHQRYYQDWTLSAPIPFLIAALAWLDAQGRRTQEVVKREAPAIAQVVTPLDTRAMVKEFYRNNPEATFTEAARAAGVSRQRIAQIVKDNGNGHKEKVIE